MTNNSDKGFNIIEYIQKDMLKSGDLAYIQYDIDFLIDSERKIIENAEKYTKTLVGSFNNELNNDPELQHKPTCYDEGAEQAAYYSHFYEERERFNYLIVQSQRQSSVLLIFSFLEGQLKILFEYICRDLNCSENLENLSTYGYIDNCIHNIISKYGVDYDLIKSKYTPIFEQKFIRNIIAHNNSNITENRISECDKITGIKAVGFTDMKYLHIEDNYTNDLLNQAEEFLKVLIKQIDEKHAELRDSI